MDDVEKKIVIVEKEILVVKGVLDKFQDIIFESKGLVDDCSEKVNRLNVIYEQSLKNDIKQLQASYSELYDKYNRLYTEFEKLNVLFSQHVIHMKEQCEDRNKRFDIKHFEILNNVDIIKKELISLVDKEFKKLQDDIDKSTTKVKMDMTELKTDMNNKCKELETTNNEHGRGIREILTRKEVVLGVFTVLCALVGAISAIFSIHQYVIK